MPEGDALFRAARALHEALAGQILRRFASPRPELKERAVEGRVVTRVRAQGKYVVLELDDGRGLLSHLRMQGRWLVYDKAGLSAKQRHWLARAPRADDEQTTLILENDRAVAVLEFAAVAELAPLATIERRLAGLGPDVLSPDFDETEAISRLRKHPDTTIAEALMLQSAVAGIGNIYKSETLFIERVWPFTPVAALDGATLSRLLKRARELMRRNLRGPHRTTFGTHAGTPYYVYERSGQHCLKCDNKIRMQRQGNLQRSTYFCPECQKAPP